ncbi:MAG: hypothetical protein FWC27_13950 [Firmicutes bacterium]|nr:hypothetical protein [Bacillota bacterium]
MDELEREEIAAEPLETADVPLEEEVPEEEVPEEEQAPEEEEQAPEEEQAVPEEKPEKPIKGPRFWAWLIAVPMMLLALGLSIPAMWNLMLTVPALTGLASEAGRNYESASEAYDFLYNTDLTAQGFGLSGLSGGTFYFERQFALMGKTDGPVAIASNQEIPRMSEYFGERVPRSLRKLSAKCEVLYGILDGFYEQMNQSAQPAEGQSQAQWQLAGLEAARALDKDAKAHALYYKCLALYIGAQDGDLRKDNLKLIKELRADPAAEPWMYEEPALLIARAQEDYGTLLSLSDARLKRNRQDYTAMQVRVKALFLGGSADKALAAADRYGKRGAVKDSMQLAKAEIFYRQGDYDKALALCDAILDKADFDTPAADSAQAAAQRAAMEAAGVKGVVLLLQGKPEEAAKLLKYTWDAAEANSATPSLNYVYTLLAAYAAGGDLEGEEAQNTVMMLTYSGYSVPQAVTDLAAGETTAEKIFTEGWGGLDA